MSSNYAQQLAASKMHGWHVYVLAEDGGEYSKIGSALNFRYRLAGVQGGNPRKLILCAVWHFKDRGHARQVEAWALGRADVERVAKRDWVKCRPERAIELVKLAIRAAGHECAEVAL